MLKDIMKHILEAIEVIENIPPQNRTREETNILMRLNDILKLMDNKEKK